MEARYVEQHEEEKDLKIHREPQPVPPVMGWVTWALYVFILYHSFIHSPNTYRVLVTSQAY